MANVAVEGSGNSALLDGPEAAKAPESPLIVRVARSHGVSPFKQMQETLALRFSNHKLRPKDYYDFNLFDPKLSMAEKRQFVGITGNEALNKRLSPPELIPTGAFVGNKVLYTALLAQMGLGTTETQAIVSTHAGYGAMPVLRDVAMLKQFLLEKAAYPVFGKPRHGSLSEGSVRIERVADGKVWLGNGRCHEIDTFCAEVLGKFPGGFLLQSALVPHSGITKITGQAIGCVRVVTVNDTGTPRPVYAVWKIPSPDAMSDNFWQSGSMIAALDMDSGEVASCHRGTGLEREEVTAHPVSGAQIKGTVLPHWNAVKSLAADAHGLFPEFGVCGYDIALCEDGPKIVECNDNPFHTLFQLATGRGITNPELQRVWDAVAARQKQRLARQCAAERKSKRSKG